mmetsp:Transcript_19339/g.23787  ORF Transcript_19339/g.23787 Transcript_19339/m.23787 type:complete len:452 (+) Transcript_19339:143-1498(+)
MSSKAVSALNFWPSRNEFLLAQLKVAGVLAIACFGDKWEPSYERNKNHNMTLFWGFHVVLIILSIGTWTHKAPRDPNSSRITFLSRPQTEEWKGWMQFAFIMYHYYRAWSAYNWIRVFVSSYVWMTGFGNFLYFDKKKDFSIERMVSMFLRINYFPLLLSAATKTSLDLYYVVPLHTEGFFMTLITCKLAAELEDRFRMPYWKSRITAILISLLVHVLFFETKAVNFLLYFSDEMHFRFQADKYSAWLGIVCGLLMRKVNEYMFWAYGGESRPFVSWTQRISGVALIALWYFSFGKIGDKFKYNPIHPYIFIVPLVGYLMIRNSSKYLTECHSWFLEFLGRNTLETYVLQFHLFMNHQVQYIPIVIPGSGAEGETYLRVANMLLCGCIFVTVAVWARKITVSTQNSVVELVENIRAKFSSNPPTSQPTGDEEMKPMIDQDDAQPVQSIEMT